MERILKRDEQAYKNMQAVAAILTATSAKGIVYRLEDTYLDYGQGWMWTTICYNSEWGGVQILDPRQWKEIAVAETTADVFRIVEDIKNDKYFSDK